MQNLSCAATERNDLMIPDFPEFKKYKKQLKERLDDYRYRHSLAVSERAAFLAERNGIDEKQAALAGLLHDITKNDSPKTQLQILADSAIMLTETEKQSPKLWHAISGAAYVRDVLKIGDPEIVSAIRYHTTARAGMTVLEKVIYIADYTSADRTYPDVQTVRELADTDLDAAILYALSYTVKDLVNKQVPVHPDTVSAYNELTGKRLAAGSA